MKALIIAAGDGKRMRPLTANTPKPLLSVAGKPLLEHTIFALKQAGVKEMYIVIGPKTQKIKEYFKSGSKHGVSIKYLTQEKPMGTADAIGVARKAIKTDFISINGDVLASAKTLKELIAFQKKCKKTVISCIEAADPSQYGVLEVKGGLVTAIHEKSQNPPTTLINTGIYLFSPEIFGAIAKTKLSVRGEYEITASLQFFIDKKQLCAFRITDSWIDITQPWDLLAVNAHLLSAMSAKIDAKAKVERGATLQGPVVVGAGTTVRAGSYIIGPVRIGANCDIGPNCYIRPSTTIGDNCKVGAGCEVKNSIIMDKSHVPHLNYVGDSVIGERCNLGAGTKIANLRLDGKNISSYSKGVRTKTPLRKLGAIIGDDVKTGINASMNPGTVIGESSFIGPGELVEGWIEPASRIITRGALKLHVVKGA